VSSEQIEIINVRQHNLKGFDLAIPLGRITALTGPSGSGKSSLALDCLHAEGQYRYLESLGMEVRRVLRLWDRPAVEAVHGLPPPVALEQRSWTGTSRSTVATFTDLADLIRLLFAACGQPRCPLCLCDIEALTKDQIADRILSFPEGTRFSLMAQLTGRLASETLEEILTGLRRDGFLRVRIDGRPLTLDAALPSGEAASLEVVVDRLVVKPGILARLSDSLGLALRIGEGTVLVEIPTEGGEAALFRYSENTVCPKCGRTYPRVGPRLFSPGQPDAMCPKCGGSGGACGACGGTGLNAFARGVKVGDWGFEEMKAWTVARALAALDAAPGPYPRGHRCHAPAARIVEAMVTRLRPMGEMGLGYVRLDRPLPTLSGGEIQRLRLATQLGRELTGVLYILDEPTVGLHPAEQEGLWRSIRRLRDQGNTVLMVEHDMAVLRKADFLVELGPGAGEQGGELIYAGPPAEVSGTPASASGPYLTGARRLARLGQRRRASGEMVLQGAKRHNLKGITVTFPLGCLVCVTGVSGSGKSTLVMEELAPALEAARDRTTRPARGARISLRGTGTRLPAPVVVDQAPLAGTKFSLPATVIGVFPQIRRLFARTPEARSRGCSPGYFSLTRKGGRCERCQGQGFLLKDLQYLPPVRTTCDVCGGARYDRDALGIRYRGFTMTDVLGMTAAQASEVFARVQTVRAPLEVMARVGLGYIRLGQPVRTLSGGEAQRLKMARELARPRAGAAVYLMDEPSMGLHPTDMTRLLATIDELLDQGNSVLIIEHQPEILALADWIIELGPEGGPGGGHLVAEGPPETVALADSPTAPYLASVLTGAPQDEGTAAV